MDQQADDVKVIIAETEDKIAVIEKNLEVEQWANLETRLTTHWKSELAEVKQLLESMKMENQNLFLSLKEREDAQQMLRSELGGKLETIQQMLSELTILESEEEPEEPAEPEEPVILEVSDPSEAPSESNAKENPSKLRWI